MTDSSPNILWISLESVRADHTSLHGYGRDTTPFLSELSDRSDATILDPMIAASNWTPASTASMLTGTHLSTHQVGQDGKANHSLPSSVETLPQLLSDAGYTTVLFAPNPYISYETGLVRGFDHSEMLAIGKESFIGNDSLARDGLKIAFRRFLENPTFSPREFKHDLGNSTNCFVEYRTRRFLKSNRQANPFFLYAHIQSPHHAYHPISKFRDVYTDEIKLSTSEADALSDDVYEGAESITERIATGLDLSPQEWAAIEAMYDADIRYADHTVERLVRMVEEHVDGPLVIVVVGDHGDLFGEYGLLGHNLVLHDGLIRVPGLVVGINDVIASESDVTQHIDLTSTIANMAGVSTSQFQGRDIRESSRPYAISQLGSVDLQEYTDYNDQFDVLKFFESPHTSIRTTDWKLLTNDDKTVLYELPHETTDVVSYHPEKVAELKNVLDEECITWNEYEGELTVRDEATKERLKDLGYLT